MMRGLLLLLCAGFALAQYEGHQLLQLHPESEEDSRWLWNLMIEDDDLDFWTEPSRHGEPVDVLVPPERFTDFVEQLNDMDYSIRDTNMQRTIDEEMRRVTPRVGRAVDLDDWNDFDSIASWIQDLPSSCADGVRCSTRSLGTSHEGRDMWVFEMSTGDDSNKEGFWVDATIHAREWLATGTILKIMDHMVQGGSDVDTMLDRYNFYFLPVMNPDGYAYSWTSGQRLWRKNRGPNSGSSCIGTDLNRNYNYKWGEEGVSHSPCSDLFCGSSGGSELDTILVQNEAARLSNERHIPGWVTIHSYGRMWMFPWGNTINHSGQTCERASDHDEMNRVANLVANAIAAEGGLSWARGTSCEVIYETTGATDDYVKGTHGVDHAICPELRGNSFIVSTDEIEPSFREIWAGLVVMAREMN